MGSNIRPAPISAVWSGGLPGSLAVTFDQPLVAGAVDFLNWIAAHANFNWTFSAAVAAGAVVTLTPVQGSGAGPEETLTFTPPPFDVISLITGLFANQFIAFPIT